MVLHHWHLQMRLRKTPKEKLLSHSSELVLLAAVDIRTMAPVLTATRATG